MASLADLFNPSTLIILGIVALFIALVVVYFESKMREQNHKIASMLSLVSTLAEDMNGVKMGLNHLAMTSIPVGGSPPQNTPFPPQNLGTKMLQQNELNLIEVSDDESEEDESEEEIMSDSELESDDDDVDVHETSESDNEDEDDNDDENIKVVKLNISDNIEHDSKSYEDANFEFEPEDDLAVLEDMDDIPQISEDYAEEVLNLTYEEVKDDKPLEEEHFQLEETTNNRGSELKTISINLGDETHSEHIDYKKLQLPKLRSIAVEKGLTTSSDAQKLKKPELLKLLGVE